MSNELRDRIKAAMNRGFVAGEEKSDDELGNIMAQAIIDDLGLELERTSSRSRAYRYVSKWELP